MASLPENSILEGTPSLAGPGFINVGSTNAQDLDMDLHIRAHCSPFVLCIHSIVHVPQGPTWQCTIPCCAQSTLVPYDASGASSVLHMMFWELGALSASPMLQLSIQHFCR